MAFTSGQGGTKEVCMSVKDWGVPDVEAAALMGPSDKDADIQCWDCHKLRKGKNHPDMVCFGPSVRVQTTQHGVVTTQTAVEVLPFHCSDLKAPCTSCGKSGFFCCESEGSTVDLSSKCGCAVSGPSADGLGVLGAAALPREVKKVYFYGGRTYMVVTLTCSKCGKKVSDKTYKGLAAKLHRHHHTCEGLKVFIDKPDLSYLYANAEGAIECLGKTVTSLRKDYDEPEPGQLVQPAPQLRLRSCAPKAPFTQPSVQSGAGEPTASPPLKRKRSAAATQAHPSQVPVEVKPSSSPRGRGPPVGPVDKAARKKELEEKLSKALLEVERSQAALAAAKVKAAEFAVGMPMPEHIASRKRALLAELEELYRKKAAFNAKRGEDEKLAALPTGTFHRD